MKKVLFGLAAVLVAAGIFSAAITAPKATEVTAAPAAALAQAGQKWEYKITDSKDMGGTNQIEPSLNKLGQEGWELVSVNVVSSGITFRYLFVLKRPA